MHSYADWDWLSWRVDLQWGVESVAVDSTALANLACRNMWAWMVVVCCSAGAGIADCLVECSSWTWVVVEAFVDEVVVDETWVDATVVGCDAALAIGEVDNRDHHCAC